MRTQILFSDRHAVMDAIMDPGALTERKSSGEWSEHEAHWQARAVLKALQARGLLTVPVNPLEL